MKKIVWLDMDGTISRLYDVEDWLPKLLAEDASPYEEARPMLNLSILARYLNKLQAEGWELGIISWGSKLASAEYLGRIEVAKRSWLHQHLTSVSWNYIHVVEYGRDKWEVCGGGILFDDEEKNRNSWQDVAYAPNEIISILKKLLRKDNSIMSKTDFETDGLHNGQPIYCPVNAYGDCVYCDKNNICHIQDPIEDCSDFGAFFESWEDWEELE